jgi:hypothetical protein
MPQSDIQRLENVGVKGKVSRVCGEWRSVVGMVKEEDASKRYDSRTCFQRYFKMTGPPKHFSSSQPVFMLAASESNLMSGTAMKTVLSLVSAIGLFLVGAIFCSLLMTTEESVLAHGEESSEAIPPAQLSPSNHANVSSAEGAGLQAACWALSIPYGAAKMAYAIGGGFVGGLAWAMTGGDMEVAKSIWIPSMTGDYVVQPQHLMGEKHLYFVGMSSEELLS